MVDAQPAAFGRLCVETIQGKGGIGKSAQPPSGGCVLKHQFSEEMPTPLGPAAFGRLCVETLQLLMHAYDQIPAAFGRLCVETTLRILIWARPSQPPSGGCVLKPLPYPLPPSYP